MVVLSTWRRLGFIDCLFVPCLTRDNISKKRYHETTTHRYVWWMCGSRKQIKQEEKITVAEEHSHQIKNSRTSMPQGSPLSPLFPSHRFDILLNTLLLLNKKRTNKKERNITNKNERKRKNVCNSHTVYRIAIQQYCPCGEHFLLYQYV